MPVRLPRLRLRRHLLQQHRLARCPLARPTRAARRGLGLLDLLDQRAPGPHSGHFPSHFAAWYPQAWQLKWVFAFAMGAIYLPPLTSPF